MNDKELLELAAKAAGIKKVRVKTHVGEKEYYPALAYDSMSHKEFNPLDHDGDALRLAVKLKFWVQVNHASVEVELWQDDCGETKTITEYADPDSDFCAATRRAIVRSAAEIGKSMA